MSTPPTGAAHPPQSKARLALKVLVLAALLAAVYQSGGWLTDRVSWYLEAEHSQWAQAVLWGGLAAYVLFMMLPFVPGIEIGLAVMMIGGVKGIVLVYLATVLALSLSFALGRLIPLRTIGHLLRWLHLQRAANLADRLGLLTPRERMDLMLAQAPARAVPFLLRHRYVALALVLNLPGNALIGGGGGIGLLAGVSGMFRFPLYLLVVVLATSPVPLLLLANAGLPLLYL